LVSASRQGTVYGFAYNGLGNRYQQTNNGETTTYTLDLAASLPQVLSDGTYMYLYGVGRFAQRKPSGTSYFLTDALGSVRHLSNKRGLVNLQQSFDPFGNLLSRSGYASSSYGFVGEWTDATGLQYLRARYYSPDQGRFITRDLFPGVLSITETLHPYVYALNNPVLYTDPSGEIAPLIIAAIMGGLLGGFLYYALPTYFNFDPCTKWDWYQAAFWAGAGAVLVAAFGAVIYGGWWAGVQFGWWGKIISDSLAADGDLTNEIVEATQAFGKLSQAANYLIQQGSKLKYQISGTGLRVHHLIEQRFASALGKSAAQARKWLSVAVTQEEHQIFINAWRKAIGYIDSKNPLNTSTATLDDIWLAAQDIYAKYTALLEAARKTIFEQE
jgi:RHS repeat-associated protein